MKIEHFKLNISKIFRFLLQNLEKLVKFTSELCKQKLQAKTGSKNEQKSKISIQNKANNDATMNQKTKS